MGKKSFLLLMIVLPFTNIISHRIDETIGVYILLGLFVLSFVFSKTSVMKSKSEKDLMFLCKLCASLVLIYALISYGLGINNIYYIRFYGLFLLLLPFLAKKNAIYFYHRYLPSYLKYLIILITSSIIIDTILISIGLLELEPMYDPTQYSYWGRPMGLFGQPSVNSTLLCFFYIFYNSLNTKDHKKLDSLFTIVTIGVLLQRSGSGFISYFFVLLLKYGLSNKNNLQKIHKKFIFFGIVLSALFIWIVQSNKVKKISLDYMLELSDFSYDGLWLPYLSSLKSPFYVFFGVPGTEISIDLGPLFIIATVGVLFFVFLTLLFLFLYGKTKQISMKIAIIMLLIGNLHYPVMFYFIMNFIWFFIIYHIYTFNNEKKVNSGCVINVQSKVVVSQGTN